MYKTDWLRRLEKTNNINLWKIVEENFIFKKQKLIQNIQTCLLSLGCCKHSNISSQPLSYFSLCITHERKSIKILIAFMYFLNNF